MDIFIKAFETHPVAILVLVVAVIIGLSMYAGWRRRNDLAELAASMGVSFQPAGPEPGFLESTGLELFRVGRSHSASSLIQIPSAAGELRFFDYSYSTGSGKNRTTHNFTVALVQCSRCEVPDFDLKPESFLYKIGEAIGFKDIDLPAFPLFSDKYRLTGTQEAAIHMFFTPARAAWFERNLGLRVQGSKNFLVLFKREGHLPVRDWQGFIEEVRAFAAEVLR